MIQSNFWKIARWPTLSAGKLRWKKRTVMISLRGVTSPGFNLLVRVVPAFAPPLVHALFSTCGLIIHNRHVYDEWRRKNQAMVGTMWHKDLLTALHFFRRTRIVVMVSRSKDGELVARALHRLGYRTVRGSSSAGGAAALLELTRMVRDGWTAAIVADGPRGPARIFKMGAVIAAKESGVPLIPMGFHATPAWTFRNWDGTMIPKPFSRIAVAFGEPSAVPLEATREECERIRSAQELRMAELESLCRRSLQDP
jgi:lysophospholipid acyltransferase (LPLAT)-like uncharacterized protein